jgi:hypothetical protein
VLTALVAGAATAAALAGLASAGGGPHRAIHLTRVGSFAGTGAEISAYDPRSERLFVTDAGGAKVDIVDISDPASPALVSSIDVTPHGAQPNSVAVSGRTVAVAIQADPKTDPGVVAFFDIDGNFLTSVEVGALPDMLTFTPNGRYVLVANEAEPDDDYLVDPEGSVSVIELRTRRGSLQATAETADFDELHGGDIDPGVRIFGPDLTTPDPDDTVRPAQDFEPEYIAVSNDSRTAWVTLQENNAVAILDVKDAEFEKVEALGYKDHSLPGNELDGSDRDGLGNTGRINIASWPVLGMYLPDEIASYTSRGRTFLVTANEGDSRDYDGFSEETSIGAVDLDDAAFPSEAVLKTQDDIALGRLTITNTQGDTDGDGDYDKLYAFGGRSFSIWSSRGELVFDSGSDFEDITALEQPTLFNSESGQTSQFDRRSDNKGPEPEGVTVGEIHGRTYAFIGLERVGGVMVYDVSDPREPRFVEWVDDALATDQAPEGLLFVSRGDSPTHDALLVLTNEVSGNTSIYEIDSD